MVSLHITALHLGVANADPGRIAAQVVSGIGFLGVGTILRAGLTIRGLTTAAPLWCVTGVGLAVGTGFYLGTVLATALVLVVLVLLSRIDRLVDRRHLEAVRVVVEDRPGRVGDIGTVFGHHRLDIGKIEMFPAEEGLVEIVFHLRRPAGVDWKRVSLDLAALSDMRYVERSSQ